MSYHLLGDYEMANSILDAFRTNQMKGPYDYEHSELLLYQNMVLAESGQYDRALLHLHKFQSQILDKLSVKETSGEYYLKLKRLVFFSYKRFISYTNLQCAYNWDLIGNPSCTIVGVCVDVIKTHNTNLRQYHKEEFFLIKN